MTAMTLFGKQNNAALALLDGVEDNLTSTLAGSSASMNRRISIDGSVFREVINGKEVRVNEERAMNAVIVNAAPISRMFFAGTYVKGQVSKPTCWSSDTQRPDPKVPEDQRQAEKCIDCKQNIRGSASQGEGRACRYQQRVAVMLDGALDKEEVYQMTLPATSVFGDGENGKLPLQAYGRYLKAHNTHAISIVTEMRFDTSSSVPKLTFKAVRPLEEDELKAVIAMREHPDTIKAITLNVSQMDGVIPSDGEKKAPVARPAPEPVKELAPPKAAQKQAAPEVVEEPIEEPKKVAKKSAPPPEDEADLSKIIDEWDDA
jgi:hypothetical protein